VWSSSVVQPRYKTPIKLDFEKYSTAGTRGTDSACWFKVKHDEAAGPLCAVREDLNRSPALEIPAWMFDAGICSQMRHHSSGYVSSACDRHISLLRKHFHVPLRLNRVTYRPASQRCPAGIRFRTIQTLLPITSDRVLVMFSFVAVGVRIADQVCDREWQETSRFLSNIPSKAICRQSVSQFPEFPG
jgi:hypothetical protein